MRELDLRRLFLILALLALVAVTVPATSKAAGFTFGNVEVQVTLVGTCGVSNSSLNFGLQAYNPGFTPDIPGVGSVDVICSSGTSYSVDLSQGAHAVGSPSQRRLYFNSGGVGPLAVDNFINYGLYSDVAHNHVWGLCCNGSRIPGFIGNGAIQHHPLYGLIPAGSMTGQAPGTYTDTVIVFVSF